MGATEGVFGELARRHGLAMLSAQGLPWLSNCGHHNARLREACPATTISRLQAIFTALSGNEAALQCKRVGSDPRPDFLLRSHSLIVEVDELQHFTSARLRVFSMYPAAASLGYDPADYCAFIERWRERADKYRIKKRTSDFDFACGRQHQRAYFDAVRDLAAPAFGLRVLRIPAPEYDPEIAFQRLLTRLGNMPTPSTLSGA